jgi:hypothetical protein
VLKKVFYPSAFAAFIDLFTLNTTCRFAKLQLPSGIVLVLIYITDVHQSLLTCIYFCYRKNKDDDKVAKLGEIPKSYIADINFTDAVKEVFIYTDDSTLI